ncbi:MAG: hypothetical protein H6859_00260 [Rhodospirillales bacterium]|nr:MAG: hypothetical protein H6859_00260 [Rhodospirillales bacterium]
MSTTDKSVKFFPKHLEDQPSDTDKFGGGEKIAQAIKEIIDNTPCDNDLYRRKPIGLLGGWGSGKSSVIKNLSRLYTPEKAQAGKAKKSPELKTYIFEFDAWVYENDPIRRSFLEAFVKFLAGETTPNGDVITTEEEWQDDLDRVKGQSEDHITTSTPVLTESGKTLGISLMLFPIGLAMLANRIDAAWYYYLLLAFLGIPFWVGYWANKFHTDKENVLSLFFNKTTDKVVNHIVKTPDPTAIEFQDIFSKILNKCLSNENTRLIVVIDNLDRLPEDKALALWATMRSFFVDREGDSAAFDNLWLIVPLDPVSLKVLFDGENIDQPSVDAKIKSYLEKTFEITFRVAPPVLSDWEKFLIEKGQEAFYDPSIASKNDWKTS